MIEATFWLGFLGSRECMCLVGYPYFSIPGGRDQSFPLETSTFYFLVIPFPPLIGFYFFTSSFSGLSASRFLRSVFPFYGDLPIIIARLRRFNVVVSECDWKQRTRLYRSRDSAKRMQTIKIVQR
jgi:hypothetical protein